MRRFTTIKCPKCGYEYMLDEIFLPNALLGKTKNITRDEEGKITYFEGHPSDTNEEYTCDKCNCTFNVEIKMNIETSINEEHDFSEDYTINLNKNNEKGLW